MTLEVVGDPDLLSDSGSELEFQAIAYEDFGISAIMISQTDGALTDEDMVSDDKEKGWGGPINLDEKLQWRT